MRETQILHPLLLIAVGLDSDVDFCKRVDWIQQREVHETNYGENDEAALCGLIAGVVAEIASR